jgi:hypothetical protein
MPRSAEENDAASGVETSTSHGEVAAEATAKHVPGVPRMRD